MNEGEARQEEEQDTESLAESVDDELSDEIEAVQSCEKVSLCRTIGIRDLAACVWTGPAIGCASTTELAFELSVLCRQEQETL